MNRWRFGIISLLRTPSVFYFSLWFSCWLQSLWNPNLQGVGVGVENLWGGVMGLSDRTSLERCPTCLVSFLNGKCGGCRKLERVGSNSGQARHHHSRTLDWKYLGVKIYFKRLFSESLLPLKNNSSKPQEKFDSAEVPTQAQLWHYQTFLVTWQQNIFYYGKAMILNIY